MFICLSRKVAWLPALSVIENLFSWLSSLLIEYGRITCFFCSTFSPQFSFGMQKYYEVLTKYMKWPMPFVSYCVPDSFYISYGSRLDESRWHPVVPPCRWDRALESEHMWARCSNQLATFMRMTKEPRKVWDGKNQTRGEGPISFLKWSTMGSFRAKWATWLTKPWFYIHSSLTGTTIPVCSAGTLLFFAVFLRVWLLEYRFTTADWGAQWPKQKDSLESYFFSFDKKNIWIILKSIIKIINNILNLYPPWNFHYKLLELVHPTNLYGTTVL